MAANAELNLTIGLIDKASAGISKITGGLGTLAKVGGAAALGGAVAGVGALSAALVGGIGDAREAAQVMAATENVIKSMGRTGQISADQIAEMAGSLSAAEGKSLFGDSDIQAGQNMLLTFANINEVLPDATQAMVDMTQFMGGDMVGASTMLGKALDNPTQGLSALSRVGVSFSEQQKEQIKTMQEAGNMAGAQGVILEALQSQFGGAALAAAQADGGMAMFKDRMGELAESVGARVLPALNSLMGWLNSPEVQAGITAVVDGLINGFVAVGNFIQPVIGWISDLAAAFQSQGEWSSSWLETFTTLGGEVLTKLGEIGTSILNWIIEQAPLWGAQLLLWGQQFIAWVSPYIQPMLDALGGLATSAWNWVSEQAPVLLEKLGTWGVKLAAWILPQIPVLIENLGSLVGSVVAWIGEQIPKLDTAVRGWGIALSKWIDEVAIPNLGPAFAKFDAEMGRLLTEFISRVSEKAAEAAREFVAKLGQGLVEGLPHFRDVILPQWADAIFTWLSETAPQVLPKAKEIAQSIINGIKEKQAELLPMLDGWATSIFGWLNETASKVSGWAVQIGTNMITGMIGGIQAQAAAIAAAASKVVLDAIQAAKNAILSRSPSRKTRDEIGKPMGEGIVLGITETAESVKQAMGKTVLGAIQVADMIDGAKKSGKNVATAFKGGLAEGLEDEANVKQILGGKLRAAVEVAMEDVKQILGGKLRDGGASAMGEFGQGLNDGWKNVKQIFGGKLRELDGPADVAGESAAHALIAGFSRIMEDFDFGGADLIFNPGPNSTAPDRPTKGEKRAMGGPVSAYTPYLVGERGPEMFMPRSNGTIIPNHQLSTSTQYTIHVDARGASNPAEVEAAGYRGALRAVQQILGNGTAGELRSEGRY